MKNFLLYNERWKNLNSDDIFTSIIFGVIITTSITLATAFFFSVNYLSINTERKVETGIVIMIWLYKNKDAWAGQMSCIANVIIILRFFSFHEKCRQQQNRVSFRLNVAQIFISSAYYAECWGISVTLNFKSFLWSFV